MYQTLSCVFVTHLKSLLALSFLQSQYIRPVMVYQIFIIYQYLDKGLNDFGLLFTEIDLQKYETIPVPMKDTWGGLMRKDSPLAEKETICPEDLWDKPLIVSHQKGDDVYLNRWLQREKSELHIVATYNLIFNASLLVDEGLGYTLCYDKLVNTQGSNLCFRPHDRLICRSILKRRYESTLSTHIRHLRKIIEENPSKPVSLITIKGLGYRLNLKEMQP